MAIIVNKSELNGFGPAVSTVEQSGQGSNSVSTIISQFQSGSAGVLSGEIWKQEGNKLELFMTALKKGTEAANKLAQMINQVINELMAAWDARFGDDIDDSYYDQLAEELARAEAELNAAKAAVDQWPEGSAKRLEMLEALEAAQRAYDEALDLFNAFKKFLDVYNAAVSKLNNLASDLESDFGSTVKGMTASAVWNFSPY